MDGIGVFFQINLSSICHYFHCNFSQKSLRWYL